MLLAGRVRDESRQLRAGRDQRDRITVGGTGKQAAGTLTIDFRWLPPTRANLRELTAPIPPGFREAS